MSGALALLAEFDSADAVTAAVRAADAAGYTRLDAFSPFPLRDAAGVLGHRPLIVPLIAVASGLIGAAVQYYSQFWMNAVDYPINVGGRPLHAWPAFLPATIIVGILWAAVASVIGMLVVNRLPRLHHPLFDAPGFERATQDRFFLCISGDDPKFDRVATARFLERLDPSSVTETRA